MVCLRREGCTFIPRWRTPSRNPPKDQCCAALLGTMLFWIWFARLSGCLSFAPCSQSSGHFPSPYTGQGRDPLWSPSMKGTPILCPWSSAISARCRPDFDLAAAILGCDCDFLWSTKVVKLAICTSGRANVALANNKVPIHDRQLWIH